MDVLEDGFRSSFNLQQHQPLVASKARVDVHLRTVDFYYHHFKINQTERLLSEIPRLEQTVESMKRLQQATNETVVKAAAAMSDQASRPSSTVPSIPVKRSDVEWVSEVKGHILRYRQDSTKTAVCNGILSSGRLAAKVEVLRTRNPTESPKQLARRMLVIQLHRDRNA